jgi:hypothetical protein
MLDAFDRQLGFEDERSKGVTVRGTFIGAEIQRHFLPLETSEKFQKLRQDAMNASGLLAASMYLGLPAMAATLSQKHLKESPNSRLDAARHISDMVKNSSRSPGDSGQSLSNDTYDRPSTFGSSRGGRADPR